MKCAFWGVDERSLVVVPIEYNIGVSSGLSVYYPYAGTNLAQHFNLLRATHSPNLYEQINIAAVHLGLGLEDVHKRVRKYKQFRIHKFNVRLSRYGLVLA